MVVIGKQVLKAYILLESLVAMMALSLLCGLLLDAFRTAHRQEAILTQQNHQLEAAETLLQSGEDQLEVDGALVKVMKETGSLAVHSDGKEIIHVEEVGAS